MIMPTPQVDQPVSAVARPARDEAQVQDFRGGHQGLEEGSEEVGQEIVRMLSSEVDRATFMQFKSGG